RLSRRRADPPAARADLRIRAARCRDAAETGHPQSVADAPELSAGPADDATRSDRRIDGLQPVTRPGAESDGTGSSLSHRTFDPAANRSTSWSRRICAGTAPPSRSRTRLAESPSGTSLPAMTTLP